MPDSFDRSIATTNLFNLTSLYFMGSSCYIKISTQYFGVIKLKFSLQVQYVTLHPPHVRIVVRRECQTCLWTLFTGHPQTHKYYKTMPVYNFNLQTCRLIFYMKLCTLFSVSIFQDLCCFTCQPMQAFSIFKPNHMLNKTSHAPATHTV